MSRPKSYDFAGWATRIDIPCADGRTIRHNAFKDCDGTEVPLVWNHDHGGPNAILGLAYLEHRDEGVYCYGKFNETSNGKDAKELVKSRNITNLSIFANHLKESCGNVMHGVIREVSLVLAGANPGARIETVLCHGDGDDYEESAKITMPNELSLIEELAHSDSEEEKKEDPKEEEKKPEETKKEEAKDTDEGGSKMAESEKTVKDVFDTLTEEQKTVVYALIGQALEDAKGGNEEMKHNAFEDDSAVLQHNDEALNVILADGKRFGSLKESFLAHAGEYGITNIEYLFPDAVNYDNEPGFINNEPSDWVSIVVNGIHHSPMSRFKSIFADITEDDARAKGYIKGKLKKEEVFSLLKRQTGPTTIYKKQKLDRDDIIDIKDFNVVAWLKKEMRTKLNEEIARAVLFGDGRLSSSDDKIDEQCIRPALTDASLYTIAAELPATISDSFVDGVVMAMIDYQGSGNTTAFLSNETVTKLLLIKDTQGHRLYPNVTDLANAMGVSKIVKLPAGVCPTGYHGIILDLKDYNAGSDKGGEVNMFDDFDIDYNQQKYLMETRMSGALVKPYAAVALKIETPAQG